MREQRLQVIVAKKTLLVDGVMGFELRALDDGVLPAFSAGAHIDVELPCGLIRQYSLCNDPTQSDRYELGILLEPDGRGGSRSAHQQLTVGDRLWISAPRNHFPLDDKAGHSLLLAGGIGITPLLSMAASLYRAGRSFELHYCGRSRRHTAFLERLADSPYADRVFTHFDDGVPSQRFDAEAVCRAVPDTTHLYVCGPGGFMDHVLSTARALGWSERRLHQEHFAAPARESDPDAGDFEVEIASTGQRVRVTADQSVAEALLAAGIEVSLSCEQGICGSCAMQVIAGEPDHRDQFFSEDEHAAGRSFTPCCSRSHSPRLVLEL